VRVEKGLFTLSRTLTSLGTGSEGSGKSPHRACAAALAAGTLVLVGCNARERVDHDVWTLFDFETAYEVDGPVAIGATFPTGIPASALLTENAAGALTLKVQRAFAEEKPAAFVTTELWVNYDDAIWLQPLYAQFVGADLAAQIDAPLVIDFGPESAFYSPFWQVNYAVVGDVPGYRSSKDLLDAASLIIPAGMKTCPLRPLDVVGTGLALPMEWDAWNASISLQNVPVGEAVYEDEERSETVGVFDFGHDLFELAVGDHGAVVEASPMFLFVDAGGTALTSEPRVLGAGPVGVDAASGRPRPRYGGLWRVYQAVLPGSAGPFHGDLHTEARAAAMRAGGDPLDYEGRVAIDTSCFDAAANDFPDGCVWLDSQAKLESLLGSGRLVATDVTQTGPIVLYDKQPVPVNP
jgi:hypothetical protein